MKFSCYNSILRPNQDSILLYNAVSDRFMVMKHAYLESLTHSIEEFGERHPEILQKLRNGRFLIDDINEEIEFVVNKGVEICGNHNGVYNTIINPTLRCNFRCWYCYEEHDGETKMKPSTIEKVKKHISLMVSKEDVNEYQLSFFGGEPLLYYDDCVKPLIDHMRTELRRTGKRGGINFTSNGYLLCDRMIDHLTEGNERISFQITLDGDRIQHNLVRHTSCGIGSYDRIVRNVITLLKKGIYVILRINMTTRNIDSSKNILNDLKVLTEDEKSYLSVDFQKVWQEREEIDKTRSTDMIVKDFKAESYHTNDFYSRMNSFASPCYGDMTNSCVINYNGDVYKCTARDFIGSNRLGRISIDGNIVWDIENILRDRIERKFRNSTCRSCRIFPLCGGGCVQTSSELDYNGCSRHLSAKDKDKIIYSRFYNKIVKPHEKKVKTHTTA